LDTVKQSRQSIASQETDYVHRCEASEVAWYHACHIERVALTGHWQVLEDRWSANLPLIQVPDPGPAKKAGMYLK
jgi:hypothetical protein